MLALKILTFPVWLPFSILFFWPGRILLELDFLYPNRGQVWATGRRRRSRVAAFFSSCGLWIFLIIMIGLF